MACLRGTPLEGRLGDVQCDEEGCEFRCVTHLQYKGDPVEASQGDCLLQLQLRAGDAPSPRDLNTPGYKYDEEKEVFVQVVGDHDFDEDAKFVVGVPPNVNRRRAGLPEVGYEVAYVEWKRHHERWVREQNEEAFKREIQFYELTLGREPNAFGESVRMVDRGHGERRIMDPAPGGSDVGADAAPGGEPKDERVEWDIDANLPMYTRDYLQMQKEGLLSEGESKDEYFGFRLAPSDIEALRELLERARPHDVLKYGKLRDTGSWAWYIIRDR